MQEEIWKPLIYHGELFDRFEVSNFGKLRNANTKHIYKLTVNKQGYKAVCVSLGSRKNKKLIKIHRAIAETFVNNPYLKPQINHIDGNKLNNYVDNLEWVTAKENTIHAYKYGLNKAPIGEQCGTHKLTEEDIKYIRKHYISKDKTYGSEALARKFNVAHSTISRAYYGKAWKHIT